MRQLSPVCLLAFAGALSLAPVVFGQAPDSPIGKPSDLVAPALDSVAKAGSTVDLNKWKGGNAVKGDVDGNLSSIQKDLQNTLPPLLRVADAAPLSVSASLPVLLNMDALYSVLLRVSITGRANGPHDEAEAIDGALATLDTARRDLGNRITKLASSQEKQLSVLQTTLQQQGAQLQAAQQAAATAATPPAPAKTTKKRKPTAKPAATPAPAAAK